MGIHDTDPNTPNKEFAPEGWHVPSDVEWTTLANHLIANGYNYDDTTEVNKIAKAMASTTGWLSSTILGYPGNDQGTNNSSGFNAFPDGARGYAGLFDDDHWNFGALFWSSTSVDEAIHDIGVNRYLLSSFSDFIKGTTFKHYGLSVRFVRD